jgi:succinyl-CoA synthetase alpha subunit/citrate synthase
VRPRKLSGLLKKGDRVAVSNITGREASRVSVISQQYAGNIVGGWALGKGGQAVEVPGRDPIPVFATCGELYETLPKRKWPNKLVVYSPPEAVYGDVKEAIEHGGRQLQTIFIITENVSIEVIAKIRLICGEARVDVVGGNTLGAINVHDHVRVGAVGGDAPEESFRPGSATIISNSGNMVNTIASYLLAGGIGTHFGISTGKDVLILTPLVELLKLAARSDETKLVVLYVEPGGLYEAEAIEWMRRNKFNKPVIVYVAGRLMEGRHVSLGHAGAVIEGTQTSATGKMAAFDEYLGIEPFDPERRFRKGDGNGERLRRGMRVTTLHHVPAAAMAVYEALGWKRDFPIRGELRLNPWFLNYRGLADVLPSELLLKPGQIPEPYRSQFAEQIRATVGLMPARRDMRSASHASSLDDEGQRIYGYPLTDLMARCSFGEAVVLYWTGELPRHRFEARLIEMSLIASLTNGPGTISAQAAKLAASAGNMPNVGMIAALATVGTVHGGTGRDGVRYLLKVFRDQHLKDPYAPNPDVDVAGLARATALRYREGKVAAREAGLDYERIPCLGHPVFNDKPVNYDPRERAIWQAIQAAGRRNIFLDFYHALAQALREAGVANRVWAVNLDAALACVWLGVCWQGLVDKRLTLKRVEDCAFLGFALGRAAGGAAEFLDHQDYGTPMDMRIPVSECHSLTRPRDLPPADAAK